MFEPGILAPSIVCAGIELSFDSRQSFWLKILHYDFQSTFYFINQTAIGLTKSDPSLPKHHWQLTMGQIIYHLLSSLALDKKKVVCSIQVS